MKTQGPGELNRMIYQLSKLPGLGPKSARRIILKLINNKEKIHKPLINSLADVFKNIQRCNECGALSSSKSHCSNCKIEKKKINKICVVETISDQWSIETSNVFNGYFHILGGTISLNKSENKDSLLINSLVEKVRNNSIDEVILATSSTVEGQTTAFYIQDSLKDSNIKISRLAQGIPVGGEIENLDDGTLISAFKNRKEIND